MKKFLVIMSVCAFALVSVNSEAGRPKKKKSGNTSEPAKTVTTSAKPTVVGVVVTKTRRSGSRKSTPKVNTEEFVTLSEQVSTLAEELNSALEKVAELEKKDDPEQITLIATLQEEVEMLKKGLAESNFVTEAKYKEEIVKRDKQIAAYIESETHTDLDIFILVLVAAVFIALIRNFIQDGLQKKVNREHFIYFKDSFNALRRLEALNKMLENEDQPLLGPPPNTPQ